MPKECDKNVYVVINNSAVIQGVLLFKNDVPAPSQNVPDENRTAVNEFELPVDNSMCENIEDEKCNAEKDIVVKQENGGVVMPTIKVELDEKIVGRYVTTSFDGKIKFAIVLRLTSI